MAKGESVRWDHSSGVGRSDAGEFKLVDSGGNKFRLELKLVKTEPDPRERENLNRLCGAQFDSRRDACIAAEVAASLLCSRCPGGAEERRAPPRERKDDRPTAPRQGKRGPGRPRKLIEEFEELEEVPAKRGPGRPRKDEQVRGPGRKAGKKAAKKAAKKANKVAAKKTAKKAGKKAAKRVAPTPPAAGEKRGPGRPRKAPASAAPAPAATPPTAPAKKRGRPPGSGRKQKAAAAAAAGAPPSNTDAANDALLLEGIKNLAGDLESI